MMHLPVAIVAWDKQAATVHHMHVHHPNCLQPEPIPCTTKCNHWPLFTDICTPAMPATPQALQEAAKHQAKARTTDREERLAMLAERIELTQQFAGARAAMAGGEAARGVQMCQELLARIAASVPVSAAPPYVVACCGRDYVVRTVMAGTEAACGVQMC